MIKISTDFTTAPGSRYRKEGKFSGEEFRENVLAPAVAAAIKMNEKITVDLDGTAGYGTSFLEESFGGLIRINDFSFDAVKKAINLVSDEEPSLIEEIEDYLVDAHQEKVA